jgi:uncharacterized protein YraI
MEMPMKLAVVAASLTVFLGTACWLIDHAEAAEGDRLSVSKQNVNVRSGPSTNAEILLTINAGEAIVEIATKGDWVFVDFTNLGKRGWIYGPLLDPPGTVPATPATAPTTTTAAAPAQPQAAPSSSQSAAAIPAASTDAGVSNDAAAAPATGSTETSPQLTEVSRGEEPAAVKSFRETVTELNDRAVSVAGINLFTDVRSTGGGGVQVLATDTWTSVPEAGQSSYMNALFERWQSMATGLGPLTLQILDPAGNVVMQRTDS